MLSGESTSMPYGGYAGLPPGGPYAMYVWREGWDQSVNCNDNYDRFLDWNPTDPYFSHTWHSTNSRQWLWDTCNVKGRPINKLFFYDTEFLANRDSNSQETRYLRETLREGRTQVPGLQFYALYSDGGVDVPESDHIPHIVWYNDQCAQTDNEKFDGIAVNNEDYKRHWSETQMSAYLDKLSRVKDEADKQDPPGSLKCHFSVSWVWGIGDDHKDIHVTWQGAHKPVMRHFIDIFDSLDVQVASVQSGVMVDRLMGAEWAYARQQGKQLLPLIYINKAVPGQTTFFPFREGDPQCPRWSHSYKTEAAMWRELDALQMAVPGVKPVLHYYRGAYSCGGHPGWPKHG